ncbi:MAG TPA: methyltransferase domain-containing protein [Candidatus Binatia bacterium]|jgi:2-polyprenyl-3-methyl-5-hydroxy-6-metoxy-1,4-benzoquinol methylase|nr:methyltransferase domain-containing protein [Candidatus Binatia bacterium]
MADAQFTGERLSGGDADEFTVDMQRHLAAYRYAATLAQGRAVLDAGCGEGYGSAMLAQGAARVRGLDQAEAIAIASLRHRAPNLEYRVYDLTQLERLGETFELVVSFQVIEHLHDPAGFLRGLAACTAPGGTLVVTTPNRLMSVSENPYHLREWTAVELGALAAPILPGVEVLGVHGSQRVIAWEEARGAQIQRILRLDPLGLRKLLPEVVVKRVFPMLAQLVRRRVKDGGGQPIVGPDDFTVHGDDMTRPLDLLLLWRR